MTGATREALAEVYAILLREGWDGADETESAARPEEVRVGGIYEGVVTRVVDFGAFVELVPGREGLVPISDLAEGHVATVAAICRVGEPILVKVMAIDEEQGRIR